MNGNVETRKVPGLLGVLIAKLERAANEPKTSSCARREAARQARAMREAWERRMARS